MASTDSERESAGGTQSALGVDMNLEVVTLPVSDVDRAKSFYESLGWRIDIDFVVSDEVRTVQFTPPHSQLFDPVRQGRAPRLSPGPPRA